MAAAAEAEERLEVVHNHTVRLPLEGTGDRSSYSPSEATHFYAAALNDELMCPICLSLLRNTVATSEVGAAGSAARAPSSPSSGSATGPIGSAGSAFTRAFGRKPTRSAQPAALHCPRSAHCGGAGRSLVRRRRDTSPPLRQHR